MNRETIPAKLPKATWDHGQNQVISRQGYIPSQEIMLKPETPLIKPLSSSPKKLYHSLFHTPSTHKPFPPNTTKTDKQNPLSATFPYAVPR